MLTQTHDKLEGHFNDLSRERVPLGYPVYAFEHGLESEPVQSLRKALSYSNSNHALSALPNKLTNPVIRFRQQIASVRKNPVAASVAPRRGAMDAAAIGANARIPQLEPIRPSIAFERDIEPSTHARIA